MKRFLIPVLLLIVPASAGAQEANTGTPRQDVASIRDTAELLRLERAHQRARRAEDQVIAGFAALQLWYLTERKPHLERARGHFERAADLDPRAAWAHYGHALTLIPEIDDPTGRLAVDDALGRGIGMDPASRARRALERAVTIDPELPDAAELLGRFAALTRDPGAMKLARAVLDEATVAPDAATPMLLALARTARQQGDYAAAERAAHRAAARGDAWFAAGHYEAAAALASLPRSREEAGHAYGIALDNADDTLLVRMWADVELIADEDERQRWDAAADTAAQRAALRHFWELRAALAGTTARERVAEHYRRLNFAGQNFRRWGMYGAAPLNALRWGHIDPTYSDQGIIYIRHGHPYRIYELPLSPYSVWFYTDEDGQPLSYHFMRFEGTSGWSKDAVLVRRLSCLEPEAVGFDPRLRPLAYGCNAMRIEAVSAAVRQDAERALRTVTDAPRYARNIQFHYDLYTFRGAGGRTEVVVGIGVPFAQIPRSDPPLTFRLAVVDTIRAEAVRAEVALPAAIRDPAPRALLRTAVRLSAAPGRAAAYRVTVRDERGDAGMTYGGPLVVPDYSGAGPLISDIVLAEPDREGSFVRGEHRLALAPSQVFPAGRFRAYYELYDLPAGRPYRTELSIEAADRGLAARVFGRSDPVRLRFEDTAPEAAGTVAVLRDVVAPAEPGAYLLRVRVTTETGAVVVQERRFTIPER